MDIIQVITRELKVEKWQVEAAVKLIDEGCTIPFISRYRKEATGSLNDEQLRTLHERLTYLRNLEDKKNQVLGSIEEQGKLTPELKKQILDAQTLVVVEDLYRPYRPKRRTRAIIAKEKGLEPLANVIMLQMTNKSLEEEAKAFLSDEKGVETIEDAINGAKDIIAEHISDEADYRIYLRISQGTITGLESKIKGHGFTTVCYLLTGIHIKHLCISQKLACISANHAFKLAHTYFQRYNDSYITRSTGEFRQMFIFRHLNSSSDQRFDCQLQNIGFTAQFKVSSNRGMHFTEITNQLSLIFDCAALPRMQIWLCCQYQLVISDL